MNLNCPLNKHVKLFVPDLVPEQARALASPRKRLYEQLPPGPHPSHDVPCLSIRIHGTCAHDGHIFPSDGWILQLPLDATGCHEPKQQHSVTTAFQPSLYEASGDDAELFTSFRQLPIYCHDSRLSDDIYRGTPSKHVNHVAPVSHHNAVAEQQLLPVNHCHGNHENVSRATRARATEPETRPVYWL